MTANLGELHPKHCSADCNLCADLEEFDGLYTCMNPSSDHQGHVFADDHPICNDPCLNKE